MPTYNFKAIEPRWQQFWEQNKTFRTPDVSDKPKLYILDMFPYPSGSGLHVGHPEGYTATDILSRYKRMRGFNVLHPMGWDAFGLPAEQYAIETGTHPRDTTQHNIDTFRRQIKMLGFSYDWDREVDTTDPNYFKWTQWIFLQLYDTFYDVEQNKGRPIAELPIPHIIAEQGEDAVRAYRDTKRLAYQAEVPVNWCEALGTVLANEEVVDGKSERGGHPVVRMPLTQWVLNITAYADRLLNDLDQVDWSDGIKKLQREWIGRSEGAEVDFRLAEPPSKPGMKDYIRVFTTRPDTLFGATYMVLSPEHVLVDAITTTEQRDAVRAYQEKAARKSDLERTELAKEKTGVFTGAYAVNPVNNQKIPVWIADYVLASYGTGAIMAVPGQDERDWEFAEVYDLPIIRTVQPPDDFDGKAYLEDGPAINSEFLNGMKIADAKRAMIDHLELQGTGERKINYKLRDWLFSRQRYWGEPFPILHEVDDNGNPTGLKRTVPVDELPLELPEMEDYKPSGKAEPPLGKATDWVNVEIDGKKYKRETNTMPQWAGSCWYYLRFIDPDNESAFCDPDKEKYWSPVDLYVGGAEHAVLHLLYARFWHKVLYDRGHVSRPEPFQRLVNQGMILGEMDYHVTQKDYIGRKSEIAKLGLNVVEVEDDEKLIYILRNPSGENDGYVPLSDEQIVKKKGKTFFKDTGMEVVGRAEKMSKSRGNVINPDDVVSHYGADSLRLYEMFMGPLEATKPWNMHGVEGVFRFLNRVWRLIVDDRAEQMQLAAEVQDAELSKDTERKLHQTIKKVTLDLDGMRFNTAIAAMMEFSNHLSKEKVRPKAALETLVLLLAPFAPHVAEELWSAFGHNDTLAYQPWPTYDEDLTKEDEITIPVQVNGKLRAKINVAADIDQETLKERAFAESNVQNSIDGKEVKKVIIVPNKMVNIVVK